MVDQASGRLTVTCQTNRRWTGSAPTCVEIDCVVPRAPYHGSVSTNERRVLLDGRITYRCNYGYRMVGQPTGRLTVTCQSDRRWSSGVPRCDQIRCNVPGAPRFGTVSTTRSYRTLDQTITYRCNNGYEMVDQPTGRLTVTCQEDSSWSSHVPRCIVIDCVVPDAPRNGAISKRNSRILLDRSIIYTCNHGYEMIDQPTGRLSATCQRDRTWSAEMPRCIFIECDITDAPAFGSILRTFQGRAGLDDRITYICNDGYRIAGQNSATATCQDNRRWSHDVPICEEITCPDRGSPDFGNANETKSSWSIGDAVSYSCTGDTMIRGAAILVCESDGRWSGDLPTCRELSCNNRAVPDFATASSNEPTIPTRQSVTYTCSEDSELVGEATSTCQQDESWSSELPTCIKINCKGRRAPDFATANSRKSSYFVGESVTYTCRHGYELIGATSSECCLDRSWSNDLPCCEEIICENRDVPEFATASSNNSSWRPGDSMTYTCMDGYELIGEATSECLSNRSWSNQLPVCGAPCGFIANATSERQRLNSPGWPENYDDGQDCTWTINGDPGKQVILEILSINTERCCDYLRVSDDDVDIATLKGITLPLTPYLLVASSGRLLLVFHSDLSVTAGGFDAVFYETDSLTTVATTPATTTTVASCGFDATSTYLPQTITSPNYPNQYNGGLDCRWNLNAPSNDTFIEIDLVQIDTEECCDYLLILDDGVLVARITGTQYPYTYRSHSQSLQLIFSSDGSVQGTGFTLTHVTVDTTTVQVTTTVAPTCGFNATATLEPQYFFSPGWPGSYKSDETCVWHITAPLGFLIRFNFSTFDTEECCDKLFIRDNGTTTHLLRGSLGTNLVGDSTTNHVVLEFQSDGSIQRSGFYGIFYLISSNEVITTAQTTTATQEYTSAEGVGPECFNVVYANSYVEYIETPGWPYRYPPGFACEWVIHTPEPDQRLFTKFLEIDLACCEDTLWIYDGDNLVGSPITSYVLQDPISIQVPYISTTNSITVRITTGNNYATGFRMNYKIYSTDLPVLACDSNTFLTTPSVIKTPNYPEDYPNDQVCSWTLDARLGQIVVLNISDLQTEVCCDYVEITDGPDQRMIATLKKDSISENLLYKSSTNLMVVTFHSDSSQTARGLLATVNAGYGGPPEPGACGFTAVVTDEERAFHSPNYPNEYPNDLDCSWLLLSPYPGREVVFTLHDFRSEDCCDSLKINDGKNQMSTEITTMKGRLEQHRYVSTNGGLFLRFTSDASSSYRGFNASYKLVEEDFVFGTITPQPEKEDRDGLRCSVGIAISGAGIEQDTRNRTNCAAGLSCSELSTVIEATIGGASAYVDVTIERCMDTDECLSLKCSSIREFLPPFFPASFSGCSSQCCHDDGSCSASAIGGLEEDSAGDEGIEDGVGGQSTGEGIVSGGVSDGGNVTCNVGVRISTAGFEQNTQELTQCDVDYSCSELTATVFNSETSITAQVTVGQCIPSIACNSVTCEQVQNVVPQSTAQVIQECSTSCCNAEVCVGGDSGGGISSGSSSSQVEEESGGEAGSGEDCLIQDAAFFPGCTYREYANHMMMCATLFYNDYPYREITECGTNLKLYQSCAVGVNEQCLVGDLPTVLGDGVAWDEAQRDMLASQLRNMTSVIVPTYELFCDKMDDEVDEIVSNLVSFINISGKQFCDMESIDYIWRSLAEVLRAIINANDATEFCLMYKNFSMLEADLFHACDFSSLPDIPATRPLKNIMKVAPSVASRSFLLKCLALKTIEDVRPSGKCADVEAPSNGNIRRLGSVDFYQPNSYARITCDNDYRLVGSRTVVCQSNYRWSDDVPTCEAIGCRIFVPSVPVGITITDVNSFEYQPGETLQVSCTQSSQNLNLNPTLTCQIGNRWEPNYIDYRCA